MKFCAFVIALIATALAPTEAAASGLRGPANVDGASVPTLPNGISCRFCPDDDNYRFEYPSGSDWNNWHRALADDKTGGDRELTSTDKLKASAKAAHYEAHFLQHAASKQVKEEHKRVLQDAAAQADKEASLLVDAVNGGDLEDHDRILKEKMLPNDISCRFCPDDDNYRADAPTENDRILKDKKMTPSDISCRFCPDDDNYRADGAPTDGDRELTSTDKLKATAQAAHYEAHFLEHAASKQTKEEHKRALQDAAAQANKEAAMLVDAVKTGTVESHDRILKEKMLPNDISCRFCPDDDNYRADVPHAAAAGGSSERKMKEMVLPNGISCRFCPDDDNYRNIVDEHDTDSWAHWH